MTYKNIILMVSLFIASHSYAQFEQIRVSQIKDFESKVISIATNSPDLVKVSEKGIVNGVASLDGSGKVYSSQMPLIAITKVDVVTTTNDMYELTSSEGDVAIVLEAYSNGVDEVASVSYIYSTNQTPVWSELLSPNYYIQTVNGEFGAAVTIGLPSIINQNNNPGANIDMNGQWTLDNLPESTDPDQPIPYGQVTNLINQLSPIQEGVVTNFQTNVTLGVKSPHVILDGDYQLTLADTGKTFVMTNDNDVVIKLQKNMSKEFV
jgi:hypothetical protein